MNVQNGELFKEAGPGFKIIRLDSYGGECVFSMHCLADLIGVDVEQIKQAVEKKELPLPFDLLGQRCWTQEQLRDHFESRGEHGKP